MKKGFTLIELLAVVVVLGVIGAIATPLVISGINTATNNARKESARGFVKAAEFYCGQQLIAGTATTTSFTSTAGVIAPAAFANEFKGQRPHTATVTLGANCVLSTASITVVSGGTTFTQADL